MNYEGRGLQVVSQGTKKKREKKIVHEKVKTFVDISKQSLAIRMQAEING